MDKTKLAEIINQQNILDKEFGALRLHLENKGKRGRNDYQRDYARVLYSSSFRRLQGKMQLLPMRSDSFYRNRLTHSLEVSQIARGIAERINQACNEAKVTQSPINLFVVELGALAHDIGNPPFGHHGERILNVLMCNSGGFEGNAQGIRNLISLEKKFPEMAGLNLSIRSLLSIVKYFVPYKENKGKFLYQEDYTLLYEFLEKHGITHPRTLDVQIVDLADEIAYCSHDLEDALSLNYFSVDELLYELNLFLNDNECSKESYKDFKKWVEDAKKYARRSAVYKSSEEFDFIFKKELTSNIVNNLILDIDVIKVDKEFINQTGTTNQYELGFVRYRTLVKAIKKCTFKAVNRSDKVIMYEKLGTKVIEGLFTVLTDEKFDNNGILMPVEYRFRNGESKYRSVCDYIAGMMDSYAIEMYIKYFGQHSLDSIYELKA